MPSEVPTSTMNNAASAHAPAAAANRTRPAGAPGPARGPAREPDVTGADPRRWLILAVVALAQLMVVLDKTPPPVNMKQPPA